MLNCLAVGVGGFIGSICRYLVGLIPLKDQSGFPYKTLAINIVGAFVLGLLSAYAAKNPNASPRLMLMLKVGVCGGFTTFSTFAYESTTLFSSGKSSMLGTKYFDDVIYIFAALKKDASIEEHLNYKDKFLQPDVFQWESKGNLSDSERYNLTHWTKACLFVRKMDTEDGIVLPFTYVGTGTMTHLRETGNNTGTLLFDILMDHELPDYLQYDFGLPKQNTNKN